MQRKNKAQTACKATGVLIFLPWSFDRLGGVDVVVDRLYRSLNKDTNLRAWIGIQDWSFSGEGVDESGRQFLHLAFPEPPRGGNALAWLRYGVSFARRAWGLRRDLKCRGICTINAHFPTPHVFTIALLKRLRLWSGRLILSFHGSDVDAVDPRRFVWRFCASETDGVTACSSWLANEVLKSKLWRVPSVITAHNGIDASDFAARAGRELPMVLPKRYILNVGNFVPRKQQDLLLEAFAPLAGKWPDLHLVLAGGRDNGKWLELIRERMDMLGVAQRVHILEDVDHEFVPALMAHAECLVHCAHVEAFGLVLIEAGSVGTAVIAPRVGGIREILSDGESGLLYSSDSAEELRAAIVKLVETPGLRAALGQSLRERVAASFSVNAMCTKYQAVLAPTELSSCEL